MYACIKVTLLLLKSHFVLKKVPLLLLTVTLYCIKVTLLLLKSHFALHKSHYREYFPEKKLVQLRPQQKQKTLCDCAPAAKKNNLCDCARSSTRPLING
jgi:hypothetical protein